jgi:glycosyltransferase involved in cell wall biosynthesis
MKLSVAMITYNHEQFIAKALDSILMQQVDFDFEVVIGEDCSTDATRAVLVDYQNNYPDKIRLLLADKNLGMMGNFITTFNACQGDYIALLEGDDYWTSPDKLQKQVAFLDANPGCCACFHNVQITHESAPEKDHLFHEQPLHKQLFDLKDIVSSHFIPTCSTVFRARLFTGVPDWFKMMPMGDWPLHILNAEHGSYAYIDEVMASYRIHAGGVWSGRSRLSVLDRTIPACHTINRHLNGRYAGEISRLIRGFEIEAAEILKDEADFIGAAKRLVRAFRLSPASCSLISKSFWRLFKAWITYGSGTARKVN